MAAEIEGDDTMSIFEMLERRRPMRYVSGKRMCEQDGKARATTVDVKWNSHAANMPRRAACHCQNSPEISLGQTTAGRLENQRRTRARHAGYSSFSNAASAGNK